MLDTWLVLNGHKGVNQQGNKSLLSYRTGYGVPVRAVCCVLCLLVFWG
jgi:hypothetical protein